MSFLERVARLFSGMTVANAKQLSPPVSQTGSRLRRVQVCEACVPSFPSCPSFPGFPSLEEQCLVRTLRWS